MRLKAHDWIWIQDGGRSYPGEFSRYEGRGTVKTVSEHLGVCIVPRTSIKPRTIKAVTI